MPGWLEAMDALFLMTTTRSGETKASFVAMGGLNSAIYYKSYCNESGKANKCFPRPANNFI